MESDHLIDSTTYKTVESNCNNKVMKWMTKIYWTFNKKLDKLTKKKKKWKNKNILLENF